MATSARQASTELRKKAAPAKQERRKKQVTEGPDRQSLSKSFTPSSTEPYLSTSVDQYGRYILVENDPTTGQQTQVYIYVEPNGRTWDAVSGSTLIKLVKSAYKDSEVLRKELFDKGFISENEYNAKSVSAFNGAIIKAATEFSTEVADSFTTQGKIKFPTFNTWLGQRGASGDGPQLPTRDINLMDRDVIEAIVKGVYSKATDMSPEEADSFIQQETDRYEQQIKEGTLTTVKKVGGEMVRTTTKPFSTAQVEAELPERLKKQQPGAMVPKQSFDFLAFIDGLGARVI